MQIALFSGCHNRGYTYMCDSMLIAVLHTYLRSLGLAVMPHKCADIKHGGGSVLPVGVCPSQKC